MGGPVAAVRVFLAALVGAGAVLVATPADAAVYTSTGVRCTIVGTSSADVMRGDDRRNVICGRGGNDTIYARGGDDLVDGGSGNDRVYGGPGADRLLGGTGGDQLDGRSGKDVLVGGDWTDVLIGGSGADRLFGGAHGDSLQGGLGNDTLYGGTGDDRLRGEAGTDIIEGQDGRDQLSGGAEPDVLSGGASADRLTGGDAGDQLSGDDGDDWVSGDAGPDLLLGGLGNDSILGGYGRDRLTGGAGEDDLSGGPDADTVAGGPGRDSARGDAGADRVSGDTDADTVGGGDGDDVLLGGDASDQLLGQYGEDALYGQAGDDRLDGGPAADLLDGGAGFNLCEAVDADTQVACAHDTSAPTLVDLQLSHSDVDVTLADQTVTVRMHLRDDMGVTFVQSSLNADVQLDPMTSQEMSADYRDPELVAGTARDGWWEVDLTVPRGAPAGDYGFEGSARDAVGRSMQIRQGVVKVADADPDTSVPVVEELATPASQLEIDVRASKQTVPVHARLTDAGTGIVSARACLWQPVEEGGFTPRGCAALQRGSGTPYDGWWDGAIDVPAGAVGGDWNLVVYVADRARASLEIMYLGPDRYARSIEPYRGINENPLPGGVGRVHVVGVSDSNPPVVTSLAMTPTSVDTVTGPAEVTFRVEATDVEGIDGISMLLRPANAANGDGQAYLPLVDFSLSSGTLQDGTWTGTLTIPQGFPPGEHYVAVSVWDGAHARTWAAAHHPLASQPYTLLLPDDPKVTVRPAP